MAKTIKIRLELGQSVSEIIGTKQSTVTINPHRDGTGNDIRDPARPGQRDYCFDRPSIFNGKGRFGDKILLQNRRFL